MTIIDADAHIHESDRTWDFFDDADQQFRPLIFPSPDGPTRSHWVVDGVLQPHGANAGAATPAAYRQLEDIPGRLRHMDELGIDIQVLYPSILNSIAERPEVEGAMWRSYNRWIADACDRAGGRLRWICRVPLTSMDVACAELRSAKARGSCGVFLRAAEGERLLCDPFFFPLYEEASALNMPICVHVGLSNSRWFNFLSQPPDGGPFLKFKLGVVGACHMLLVNEIPQQFPNLRWGLIEASAEWIPYVVRELRKRLEKKGRYRAGQVLRDNRIFVTCQADDDLPHILEYAGEDSLVIGTDYGHADSATELHAMHELQAREDIDPGVVRKIMDDNARALYGL